MILSPAGLDAKEQIDVTTEDQQMINHFARLNLKAEELQEKFNDFKRQLENLEEAENELMLQDDFDADEDDVDQNDLNDGGRDSTKNEKDELERIKSSSNIQFVVGTSFMAVSKTEMEYLIEQHKLELKQKMKDLDGKLAPMKDEMNKIKSTLYAKFGSNINLDSDDS